jgi:hypothetical protein
MVYPDSRCFCRLKGELTLKNVCAIFEKRALMDPAAFEQKRLELFAHYGFKAKSRRHKGLLGPMTCSHVSIQHMSDNPTG